VIVVTFNQVVPVGTKGRESVMKKEGWRCPECKRDPNEDPWYYEHMKGFLKIAPCV